MAFSAVQSRNAGFGSGSASRSLAYTSNITKNNLLVVAISTFGTSNTVTVTDTKGNTYTQAGSYVTLTSFGRISLWYAFAGSNGPNTVQYNTGTGTASGICIIEYSGANGAVIDSANSGHTDGSSTTAWTTGNVTVNGPGELLIGAFGWSSVSFNSITFTPDTGYTVETNQVDGFDFEGCCLIDNVSASATAAVTATANHANAFFAIGVSFTLSVPVVKLKEIVAGPPLPGSPWFRNPHLLELANYATAPPPTPPVQSPPDPVHQGPIILGTPWRHFLKPLESSALAVAAAPRVDPPTSYEQIARPPIPGAPWMQGAPISAFSPQVQYQTVIPPPPPAAPTPPAVVPEILYGPPILGAPWNFQRPGGIPGTPNPFSPIPVPVPPRGKTARDLPLLNRDPVSDPRHRRFQDVVSQIINSLVANGQLTQVDATTWEIDLNAVSFKGNIGSKAYTIDEIVTALKVAGILPT